MRNIVRIFVIVLPLSALIIFVVGASVFWFYLDRPYGDSNKPPVEITISRGMSFSKLARDLEEAGLVGSAKYLFLRYRIVARLGLAGPHQAGRYLLEQGQHPSMIIRSLTTPNGAQRVYTRLTIPPGLTTSRIAEIIQKANLAASADVEEAVQTLAVEYPIVQTEEGLLGYLFPDTYKIEEPLDESPENSKANAQTIIRLMADSFFAVLDEILPSWQELTRMQLHEKVILASIVEREYRVAKEAPMIAAVFNNRLKENMALQSCATVVYTIEETDQGRPFKDDYVRFNRRIFEQYLDIESPYNTYIYSGLPPGPIAIPGRVALEAIFRPAQIDSLYFVIKSVEEGTHVFSRYYTDHLLARSDYLNQYVVKD